MSSISFNFDELALKRAFQEQIESAVSDIARERTRDLDRLRSEYTGSPVEEIKPALQQVFAKDGGTVTDPELTQWAEAISAGTRIVVERGEIDW